mgnify:FL=1
MLFRSVGSSAASNTTAAVIPAGKPLQPVITSLKPDYRQMTVTWAAGRSNGEAITQTTAVATPGGASCTVTSGNSCVITGLANTNSYTFVVTSTNILGESVPSLTSAATMVGAVPFAPTSLVGDEGDHKATLRWTAADGRDFPVLSYKVTATPGGQYCNTESTSCVITGLDNGKSYTFRVTAFNVMGESLPSAESMTLIPAGPPLAPDLVTVVRGSGRVEVRWTAAAGNGSDVTGYSVLSNPGGRSCVTTTALVCVIDGLTNGTAYTFAVSATSVVGTSLPRLSDAVTPAGVPSAPTTIRALPGNKSATVSWSAPTSNGGELITGYRVTAVPGGAQCTTASPTALSCSVSNLTNGVAYKFTVIAINAIGNSVPSLASVIITPSTKPLAPNSLLVASPAVGRVKLNWNGAQRFGATLLKYEYSYRVKSTAAWGAWTNNGTRTYVVLKNLSVGTAYQLRVRITTSGGATVSKVFPFTPTK